MSSRSKKFVVETLDSWDAIHRYQSPNWIYRGLKNSKWGLETSFERCCTRHSIESGIRGRIETELLREFRRAYHEYSIHVPHPDATIEWLSLMQHYGAPTRLLDFSYSIYVAAYFAAECAEKDAAIWAVNAEWAMNESVKKYRAVGISEEVLQRLEEPFDEADEKIVNTVFIDGASVPTACPVNPFRLNERLRIQKGVFLIPGNVEKTFAANFQSMTGHDLKANVIKIIVPVPLLSVALRRLFDMNISRRSLFPGLEGYAQSLGIQHPVFYSDDPMRRRATRNSR